MKIEIVLISFLILSSCQRKSTIVELKERFYSQKSSLDSLTVLINSDTRLDSLLQIPPDSGLPDIQKYYPTEFKLLEKIGITHISSHPSISWHSPRWYYMKTNWPSKFPIYLIFNFTNYQNDSLENEKGFYEKDRYKNETWGLGDNWKMFRFVHTIDDIKY